MRLRAVAPWRIALVSLISTIKVDWPATRLSDAPTRVNSRSTTPTTARRAGTNAPIWASSTHSPTARRNALLRPQHLRLVLLQLRRHVALGAGEGLAPLVIGRDPRLVGVRDLDVVAEHLVEADLERRDTGALALPRLQRRDVLLAAVACVLELVERLVMAGPDGVAVRELSRRAVHEGAGELVAQVLQQLEAVGRLFQQRRPLASLHAVQCGARIGEPPDRVPQGAELPWRGAAQRRTARQA